jgi:uncharacterized membrane-anchored protein
VLEDIWGNPKDESVLGLIVPAGFAPTADETWAIVVSYEEDGYVKDDDAAEIDYDELLATMKKATREENEERRKAGFPEVEVVGWPRSRTTMPPARSSTGPRRSASPAPRSPRSTTTSASSDAAGSSC